MQRTSHYPNLFILFLVLTAYCMLNPVNTDVFAQVATDSGSDESPPATAKSQPDASAQVTNPFPGTHPVYFSPRDADKTGTVIILFNSTDSAQTVNIRGYNYDTNTATGALTYQSSTTLEPYQRKFLASDSVAANTVPSWSTVEITNFTDFVGTGVLYVPDGIFVDGYVVFNGATGLIDPGADQGAIPLLFSSESNQGSHFFVVPTRR